jgi:5-methylcytosine-specific restriction protein A
VKQLDHLTDWGARVPSTSPATPKNLGWTRDELILVCDEVARRGWNRIMETEPAATELSQLLRRLPIYPLELRKPNFRSTSSVSHKSVDLQTWHPEYDGARTNGGALDKVIIAEFLADPERMHQAAALLRAGALTGAFGQSMIENDVDQEEFSAPEGRLLARQHRVRERSRELRWEKITVAMTATGELACEICDFDFAQRYGVRGQGFIECHHIVPLHQAGATRTRLDDLILICANCHRMIHRGPSWLTPDELRVLIAT